MLSFIAERLSARLLIIEVAKLTQLHVVTSEVQRLICTGSLRMRTTACAQMHAAESAVLSALVVCCGLLAKWLRFFVFFLCIIILHEITCQGYIQ